MLRALLIGQIAYMNLNAGSSSCVFYNADEKYGASSLNKSKISSPN